MNCMKSSDWNANASFEGSNGSVALDANLHGYADSVSVEFVPGPQGAELLVLFCAEAGHTGAALRVKDIILAAMRHQPELWQEILSIQAAERGEKQDDAAELRGFYDRD